MQLSVEGPGGPKQDDRIYITPERAVETVLRQLSSESRLIVTGQIGCGKTALAREISTRLGLAHLQIDDYSGDADPELSASRAASSMHGGWVAEANVWQIPDAVWESSHLAVLLDYPNVVHYLRIIRRCLQACVEQPTWTARRRTVGSECRHMKIIYLYANKNRKGWRERGGITNSATPVIRCASPRATDRLLACMGTTSRLRASV